MRFSFLHIFYFITLLLNGRRYFYVKVGQSSPKTNKRRRFSSLLIVNQASTMVLLTAFFMLTTWLEEKERERRIQRYLNLVISVLWLEEIRRYMQWQDNLLDDDPQPVEPYPLPNVA